MCVTTVVKATLYSANRPILRCNFTFYYITNLTSEFCKILLCCNSVAHIASHVHLETYLLIFFANFQRFISNGWCSKSKRITVLSKAPQSTSMNPLPVLACQFFKKYYLHTSKNTLFQGSRSNIDS